MQTAYKAHTVSGNISISRYIDVPWNTVKALTNKIEKIEHHSDYQEQDSPPKFIKGQDKNVPWRLPGDLLQH